MAKTQKAPKPYMPTGQAQADASYQSLVSGATPYANSIASTTIPGLQQTATNVQNNPYAGQAQAGANAAAALGTNVVGGQLYGSQMMQGLGAIGGAAAPGIAQASLDAGRGAMNAGQNIFDSTQAQIPGAMAGQQYAGGVLSDSFALRDYLASLGGSSQARGLLDTGINNANTSFSQAQGAIPGLTGGMGEAQTLLTNGFDPQRELYNREFQQQSDQQNAINSMYGLNTSAYGAGVAGQKSQDFNTDWQNNQLARQIAALGAYGQQSGQVTSNLTNLLNTGANTYNTLAGGAVNQYGALTGADAANFSNLTNAGVSGFNDLNNSAVTNFNNLTNTGATALNQGYDNFNNLTNSAVNNFDQLSNATGRNMGQGAQLGVDALNTLMTSQQAPSQQYLAQQQAQIAALQALASGGTQALAPTQQLVNNQGNYLNIGQNATKIEADAVAARNAQAASTNAGLGKIVGAAAGFAIGGPQGAMIGATLF